MSSSLKVNHPGHDDQSVHNPHGGGGSGESSGGGTPETGRFPDVLDARTGEVVMTGHFTIIGRRPGYVKLRYEDGSEGWLPKAHVEGYLDVNLPTTKAYDSTLPAYKAGSPGSRIGTTKVKVNGKNVTLEWHGTSSPDPITKQRVVSYSAKSDNVHVEATHQSLGYPPGQAQWEVFLKSGPNVKDLSAKVWTKTTNIPAKGLTKKDLIEKVTAWVSSHPTLRVNEANMTNVDYARNSRDVFLGNHPGHDDQSVHNPKGGREEGPSLLSRRKLNRGELPGRFQRFAGG